MFGSTWGQNNSNQQQQQQQASAFGQPANTFGNAFGSNNQQQPQQQQQPTSIFGNTSNNNPSGSAFGGFGTPASTSTSNPLMSGFGAQNATNRFGGFGSTPSTGTANAFGGFGSSTTNQPTSAFGSTSTAGNAFGSTSNAAGPSSGFGAFGKPATTSAFGSTTSTAVDNSIPNTGGTPYAPVTERDAPGVAGSAAMVQYQSISCMNAYKNHSFEELRVGDYIQGRKTSAGTSSGFGPTTGTGLFGGGTATSNNAPTTGGSMFGQASNTNTGGGIFGSPSTNPTTTGTGFGGFGNNANTGTGFGGGFGQQSNQQQQQGSAFGGFGTSNAAKPTGFGFASTQPSGTSTFGGFGSNTQNTDANKGTFGSFGGTNTTGATNTFGGFGQQPQQSGGIFGQPQQQQQQPQQSGGFFGGFGNTGANAAKPSIFGNTSTSGGGIFGQQQNQPQQGTPAFGGAFGNTSTTANTGIFGQQQPQQGQQQANVFGQQQQQPSGGIFGQNTNTGTGGGLFGNTQQQQQQPAQQTSIFGNNANTGTGTSIFGGTKPATTTFGSGGLFGSNTQNQAQTGTTGGGLFGSNNPQNTNPGTTNTGGGLFSGLTGQGGLFGGANKPATGGGLFGNFGANQQQAQQPAQAGTGLFGSGSVFGQNNVNQSTAPTTQFGSGGLFGGATQQQQPSLSASIDQPISTSAPLQSLLSSTGPGNAPRAIPLGSPEKKKSNYWADIPMRSVQPRIGLTRSASTNGTKLRGFGSSTAGGSTGGGNPFLGRSGVNGKGVNPFTVSLPQSPTGFNGRSELLSSSVSTASLTANGGFVARPSPKKLVLAKKSTTPNGDIGRTNTGIRFDPALSAAAREREKEKERERESAARFTNGDDKENAAPRSAPVTVQTSLKPKTSKDPAEGDYWCRPSVEELIEMDHSQLSRVSNFTVGRVGYGEITFLQPVDLTTVGAVRDIPGGVVVFLEREASVYPDDQNKPPPGEGLNVPAEVSLDKVWALDKGTKEPIKDETSPHHRRLMRKLQSYPNTRFIDFDMNAGRWRFEVSSF